MIFYSLFYMFEEPEMKGYEIIKVEIDENEEFGEATIRNPKGTNDMFYWDNDVDIWIKEY